MPEQIYIGNFKGLKLDREPFVIDNDQFPRLFNAYAWRGRVRRKRGTDTLGRLQVQVEMVDPPVDPWDTQGLVLVAGAGNLVSGLGLETNSSIVPGSISFTLGADTYTEPSPPDGTLLIAPMTTGGTINYASGAVTIVAGGVGPLTGTFSYYPDLPVMGLEDFVSNSFNNKYPLTIAFDTKYAYQIKQLSGQKSFYNVTYHKGTNIPFTWSNSDDAQFWSTNYQSAFWATNNKPGLHFLDGTYTSGTGTTTITFNFQSNGVDYATLIVGDILWFNEWSGGSTINGLNGTVTNAADAVNGNYVVTFDASVTVAGTGITIMLTQSLAGQDGIRWYDGDPTSTTGLPTGTGLGWVNFSPPLTATTTSINDLNEDKYYLVGALAIVNFKDRLLFFGPQIQAAGGLVFQRPIQDTVIFSWNGTPYYNALVPTSPTTSESFDPTAYYVDETGKGGFRPAGVSQPALTIIPNGDVLLVGFGGTGKKTRLVFTGNDISPFDFYLINSNQPSSATYSAIEMDEGAIDIGQYGLALTNQQSSQRIDLDIPDIVFQIQSANNGVNRVNAVRDFFNQWIYFTYPSGNGSVSQASWKFPSTTLLYNYTDNTWAQFRENYTTQGSFRDFESYTWNTLPFRTWNEWRQPWNSGSSVAQFAIIIAGNPQGYVLKRTDGTGEAPSGEIKAIADNGDGFTRITSVNHCVNIGDYLYFTRAIGQTYLNTLIGKVIATPSVDTFDVDIQFVAGTYLGLGVYTRLCQPLIQTKQFPVYWQEGRKVRLCAQKYLLDATNASQVTLNINLSQDPDDIYNADPIVPDEDSTNNSLIYSQLLYTCPESTNIGLTPPNINLQMPTATGQYQIWHRMNTSLIGDTFQIGITLNDIQMRNLTYATSEITLHGLQFTVDRGPLLA